MFLHFFMFSYRLSTNEASKRSFSEFERRWAIVFAFTMASASPLMGDLIQSEQSTDCTFASTHPAYIGKFAARRSRDSPPLHHGTRTRRHGVHSKAPCSWEWAQIFFCLPPPTQVIQCVLHHVVFVIIKQKYCNSIKSMFVLKCSFI